MCESEICLNLCIFNFHEEYDVNPFSVRPRPSTLDNCNYFATFQHAIATRRQSKGEPRAHWLDYADDKYDVSSQNYTKFAIVI